MKIRHFEPQKVPAPPPLSSSEKQAQFQALLKSPSKLVIEVGGGTGTFAINYAQKHPYKNMISFEKTHHKFQKFCEKTLPPNLMAIQGDAIWWICHFIKPEKVSEYFILHPNPYYKKKHHHLRWHYSPFMHYMLKTLRPNGLLTLSTNETFYKKEVLEIFQNFWSLKLIESKRVLEARTDFERKYLDQKKPCYNLIFSKS